MSEPTSHQPGAFGIEASHVDILQQAPRPDFPRYSDRPFPSYRFVPGRNPHPTSDPRGHSYLPPGQPHPRSPALDAARWTDCPDYLYGIDLYNLGYWWEAHEAWEGVWRLTDRSEALGRALQGFIQVSACHLKILLGHRAGAERLAHSSLAHLRFVADRVGAAPYLGVSVADWAVTVRAYFHARLRAAGPLCHDLAHFPYLRPKRSAQESLPRQADSATTPR